LSAEPTADVLRWWWVRHAPSLGTGNLIHGTDDTPADLSDSNALSRIAKLLPADAGAITSAIPRAVQTYAAFRTFNHALPIARTEPDFGEQDFGEWTGRSWDEIGPLATHFWKDPIATAPPGGESYHTMCRRVQRRIKACADATGQGEMITVAHAGPIRAALALALDLPVAASLRFEIDVLSLTRIDAIIGDSGLSWRVGAVNFRPRDLDSGI
jgi:alpha-ribazole phosphatase